MAKVKTKKTKPTGNEFRDYTPLMQACRIGNAKLVKGLLKDGAEIDGKNKDGNTALDVARIKGRQEIVNILINNQ